MKTKLMWAMALVVATVMASSSCGPGGNGGGTGGGTVTMGQTITVTDDITADTTWTKGNTYLLDKHVYVGGSDMMAAPVVLTIEAGVVIKGKEGTSLVVTRNGRLNAVGTASEPIVFTSNKEVGSRDRGDWGGVVLLGRSVANFTANATSGAMVGESFIEGFPASGTKTLFGGSDEAWSCGTLKYVRVEFGGFRLAPNNELNSLTLGACGSGTVIDYVQVHNGLDDGIEVFGGAVNLKHAVITSQEDDGLDWDNGWHGKAQFLVFMQGPSHGASGIEADNDATGSGNMPRSFPEVWNATFIGRSLTPPATEDGNNNRGIHLRRNTAAKLANIIVAGFGSLGVRIESGGTATSFTGGESFIKNSIFFKNPAMGFTDDLATLTDGTTKNVDLTPDGGSFDNNFNEATYLSDMVRGNRTVDPGLTLPAVVTAPNFKPAAGSAALTGAATPPGDSFFEATTFVGGVGTEDWTAGWTAYPQN